MELPVRGRWARWRHLLLVTIATVLAAALAVGLQVAFDVLPEAGQRPPPWLARTPWMLALMVAVTVALWGWSAWSGRARARGWPLAGLGLLHLAVVLGGLVAIVVADPEFIFGTIHRDTLALDDGRVAHLYSTGLFCSFEVYEERAGQVWIERVETLPRECEAGVTLGWSREGGYTVFGANGAELPYHKVDLSGLYWGPH